MRLFVALCGHSLKSVALEASGPARPGGCAHGVGCDDRTPHDPGIEYCSKRRAASVDSIPAPLRLSKEFNGAGLRPFVPRLFDKCDAAADCKPIERVFQHAVFLKVHVVAVGGFNVAVFVDREEP